MSDPLEALAHRVVNVPDDLIAVVLAGQIGSFDDPALLDDMWVESDDGYVKVYNPRVEVDHPVHLRWGVGHLYVLQSPTQRLVAELSSIERMDTDDGRWHWRIGFTRLSDHQRELLKRLPQN